MLVAERLAASRPVSVLHGGLTGDEQEREIGRFVDGRTSVLVATDVASQGLNLQKRARWVINLELPWNPARLEQRAGRVDRIGQARPVHVTLLVASHRAESGVLASLARKIWSAQRALGSDALQSLAPDERQLQACLLAGEPLPDAAAAVPAMPVSRSWTRHARRVARSVSRSRCLARGWRAPALGGDRTGLAPLARVFAGTIPAGTNLAAFLVPLVDRTGTLVERHVVAIALANLEALDAARAAAARSARARANRVRRDRTKQLPDQIAREHAIADALNPALVKELQPGLFEQRALRGSAEIVRDRIQIRDALDRAVVRLEQAADISAGVPRLVLLLTGR